MPELLTEEDVKGVFGAAGSASPHVRSVKAKIDETITIARGIGGIAAKVRATPFIDSTSVTDASVFTLFSFTPQPGSTVRVYATIVALKSDGSEDYGIDLAASFRVAANGAVTVRLAASGTLEQQPAGVVVTQPTIDTSGGLIRVRCTNPYGTWRWGVSGLYVERTTEA